MANTNALLEELTAGILEAGKHSVKTVDVTRMKIAPCLGCDGCKRGEKICVQKDDSRLLMNEMRQADYIVFATPVYWWGMTAQLKLAIDRLYADSSVLKGKPIGLIVTGADALDSPQYRLIREQFQCMARAMWALPWPSPNPSPPANPAKSAASPICSGRSGTWANPCKQRISSRS